MVWWLPFASRWWAHGHRVHWSAPTPGRLLRPAAHRNVCRSVEFFPVLAVLVGQMWLFYRCSIGFFPSLRDTCDIFGMHESFRATGTQRNCCGTNLVVVPNHPETRRPKKSPGQSWEISVQTSKIQMQSKPRKRTWLPTTNGFGPVSSTTDCGSSDPINRTPKLKLLVLHVPSLLWEYRGAGSALREGRSSELFGQFQKWRVLWIGILNHLFW